MSARYVANKLCQQVCTAGYLVLVGGIEGNFTHFLVLLSVAHHVANRHLNAFQQCRLRCVAITVSVHTLHYIIYHTSHHHHHHTPHTTHHTTTAHSTHRTPPHTTAPLPPPPPPHHHNTTTPPHTTTPKPPHHRHRQQQQQTRVITASLHQWFTIMTVTTLTKAQSRNVAKVRPTIVSAQNLSMATASNQDPDDNAYKEK